MPKKIDKTTVEADTSKNTTVVAKKVATKSKNPFPKIRLSKKRMADFKRCMTDPNMNGPTTEEEFKEWWKGLTKK